MAQAVRGFHLLPVYSGGFSVICLICHFNAPVRRFNSGCYPYIAAVLRALYALFFAPMVWRYPLLRGLPLALPACRLPCVPVALSMAVPDRWRSLCGCRFGSLHAGRPGAAMACLVAKVATRVAGKVAKVAGKVAVEVASVCAKVAHLPQNHSCLQDSVYKRGIFLAYFPRIDGKSCKSRSLSAHFTSKSLAAMYFCWSCSGVKPSSCGWFGVNTISCLSTMP